MGSEQGHPERVRRRKMFYVPGFDPMHPRRYRELYRTESSTQAAISGYEVTVARQEGPGFGWTVSGRFDGAEVVTEVEVLDWSDIARGSMGKGLLAPYLDLFAVLRAYLGTGAFLSLARLRKGPVLAALYPVVMLLAQAMFCILGGLFVAKSGMWMGLPEIAGILAGALFGWAVLLWFRRMDNVFLARYLIQDFAFSASAMGAYPVPLSARLQAFSARIAAALDSNVDEVLVVAHSSGVHLAVTALTDLLRANCLPASHPPLGFLSLGHAVPMVSFLPAANRLRSDLRYLSCSDALTWVDVSAPGDGCTFALCDPVAVSGAAGPGKRWPLVVSAAFRDGLSPQRWKALRRRFFRLHFQYLCAFDRPAGYDYFHITAGAMTLPQNFSDRAPSKSRIETVCLPSGTPRAA